MPVFLPSSSCSAKEPKAFVSSQKVRVHYIIPAKILKFPEFLLDFDVFLKKTVDNEFGWS